MLELLIVIGRTLALGLHGHRELVLENLALRLQLKAIRRATKRPRLQAHDLARMAVAMTLPRAAASRRHTSGRP